MRPAYLRELKELSPVIVLLVATGILAAANLTGPMVRQFDDMLVFPICAGLGLGILQGLLDRWRRDDLFSLHRPVAAVRMETARTLAGATAILVGALAFVVTHRLATLVELADRERFSQLLVIGDEPEHLGARAIGLLTSLFFAAWAVARFAAGLARIRWVLPALVLLPLAAWSLLSRVGSMPAASVAALLLATLFALGSGLVLAGDRR